MALHLPQSPGTTKQIVVVGSSNYDLMCYVARLPLIGETLKADSFEMGAGGKGANQAVAAARLGGNVRFITKVGNDMFGTRLQESYAATSIDTRSVLVSTTAPTGVALINVDREGNNHIVINAGANDQLTAEDVRSALADLEGVAVVVTGLEVPLSTCISALEEGRRAGVITVLNPSPSPAKADFPAALVANCSVCVLNEPELQMLAGSAEELDTDAKVEAAAQNLLAKGCGAVVVTLGSRGCVLVDSHGALAVPVTEKPTTVLDTTGAGDCFLGTLAFFLATGMPLPQCLSRANIAAGRSVQVKGTQSSYPWRAELPADWFPQI